MSEEIPVTQRILDAAEIVLRRHGAEKANVVDIARVLGMSHGNIYRHFPSKQALIQAVALRWLHNVSLPLEAVVQDTASPAGERLRRWFNTLRNIKRRKVLDDPELFRVHHLIVEQTQEIVAGHVATLLRQLEAIIADGVRTGEFAATTRPAAAARAFLLGTAPFHHPALLLHNPPYAEEDAAAVFALLLAGLRAGDDGKGGGAP
ncbi:TetR family transcriptional regulator [Verrucomicrobia bacterium LW23]|nr:TetR family transcriptional regulator [Verrucomicrobia bacterium LW23]